MAAEDTFSTLSITSLPNEVLRIIFTKLDWKSIYKTRLTSKFFNTFITSNIKYLPKPRLLSLDISSFEESDGSIKFSYKLTNSLKTIEFKSFYLSEDENKIEKLKNYLSRLDLTNGISLCINTTGKAIIFDLLNGYFQENTKFYYLKLFIDKNQEFESFSSFIQKMKYIVYFHIIKICFQDQIIPQDYTLPMVDKMRSLTISECDCTNFVNPLMISKLFSNNKELGTIEILSKCYKFQENLLENIKNRQEICDGSDNHRNYTLTFSHQSLMGAFDDVRNFFPCGSYHIVPYREKAGKFDACKRCDKCNHDNLITFQYYKSFSFRK
uniref:F-box domain-containing protein n=1 Tax=Strongyloides papillosus TaxID=174720 RepID=A0A0N5B9Q3_STREA